MVYSTARSRSQALDADQRPGARPLPGSRYPKATGGRNEAGAYQVAIFANKAGPDGRRLRGDLTAGASSPRPLIRKAGLRSSAMGYATLAEAEADRGRACCPLSRTGGRRHQLPGYRCCLNGRGVRTARGAQWAELARTVGGLRRHDMRLLTWPPTKHCLERHRRSLE